MTDNMDHLRHLDNQNLETVENMIKLLDDELRRLKKEKDFLYSLDDIIQLLTSITAYYTNKIYPQMQKFHPLEKGNFDQQMRSQINKLLMEKMDGSVTIMESGY